MQEEKRAAGRRFDRRAGAYEGGFTARWRDPVQHGSFDALELTANDRLLDVGCGTGAASRQAAALDRSSGSISQPRCCERPSSSPAATTT